MEKATFAAGCFWGVEQTFRLIEGVVSTRVGYTGGHLENPTYGQVCSHGTGHAEAVEVTFDPERVSYGEILEVFWSSHNPRSRNRQGLNLGDQYRSAIFFHSAQQERQARASKDKHETTARFRRRIATEIQPATTFWEAEDYHQQYAAKRRGGKTGNVV